MAIPVADIPALSFSRNFPDLIITAPDADGIVVHLDIAPDTNILSEKYFNGPSGDFTVRLKDILDSLLSLQLPTSDIFVQDKAFGAFILWFGELETLQSYSFAVLKGGVASDEAAAAFLATHWLTWQPQVMEVKATDKQYLSFYTGAADQHLIIKAYGETLQSVNVDLEAQGPVVTINTSWARLAAMFTNDPTTIDVSMEIPGGTKSYVQRYVLSNAYDEFDDQYLFNNSVGGLDVIRFTGELKQVDDHVLESALFDEETRDYNLLYNRYYQKNTGYISTRAARLWALEFMASMERYHLRGSAWKQITVKKQEVSGVAARLNDFNFEYSYCRQDNRLLVSRVELPVIIAAPTRFTLNWQFDFREGSDGANLKLISDEDPMIIYADLDSESGSGTLRLAADKIPFIQALLFADRTFVNGIVIGILITNDTDGVELFNERIALSEEHTSGDSITAALLGFELGKSYTIKAEASAVYALELTYNAIGNASVNNPGIVAEWNTFFDLPNNGGRFASVDVVDNLVRLIGGSEIILKPNLFFQNNYILSISDTGAIKETMQYTFTNCYNLQTALLHACKKLGFATFASCASLINSDFLNVEYVSSNAFYACGIQNVNLPNAIILEPGAFIYCAATVYNLPLVEHAGLSCFDSSLATSISLPKLLTAGNNFFIRSHIRNYNLSMCTNLGENVLNTNVFSLLNVSEPITLIIPATLMTCNNGEPDGDIQFLIDNYDVVIEDPLGNRLYPPADPS